MLYQPFKDQAHYNRSEKSIEPRTMQYRFRTILNKAKLPSIHFHELRHIFASSCIALGFDVKTLSELLGHSSLEITVNRYVHTYFQILRIIVFFKHLFDITVKGDFSAV